LTFVVLEGDLLLVLNFEAKYPVERSDIIGHAVNQFFFKICMALISTISVA